jgi:chromate transport protein ChrA
MLIVAFAILKAVVIALVITLALALIYSFSRQSRETLLFLGVLIVTGLAGAQPAAFIAAVAVICITAVIFGNRRRPVADGQSQGQPARPLIELKPTSKS